MTVEIESEQGRCTQHFVTDGISKIPVETPEAAKEWVTTLPDWTWTTEEEIKA